MGLTASGQQNKVAKEKHRQAVMLYESCAGLEPMAKAQRLDQAFCLMREAYDDQKAAKLLGYLKPMIREREEAVGRDRANANSKDKKAHRLEEIRTVIKPGEDLKKRGLAGLIQKRLIKAGCGNYELRTLQRDLREMRGN